MDTIARQWRQIISTSDSKICMFITANKANSMVLTRYVKLIDPHPTSTRVSNARLAYNTEKSSESHPPQEENIENCK